MKKIHLLATLAFAIVAAGVMLSSTNAAELTLQVTAGAGAGCTGGASLDLGTTASSYSSQADTGTIGGSFVCTGTSAGATGTFTITATNPVGPNSDTISSTKGKVSGNSVTAGNSSCNVTPAIAADFTDITTAQNVILRNHLGYPCTITTTTVEVAVVIPANASVGAYTGTMTFTQ